MSELLDQAIQEIKETRDEFVTLFEENRHKKVFTKETKNSCFIMGIDAAIEILEKKNHLKEESA